MAVPAHAAPDLAHDVEDRASGQGVEAELEWIGVHLVADQGAQEGGAAADEAGEPQPSP